MDKSLYKYEWLLTRKNILFTENKKKSNIQFTSDRRLQGYASQANTVHQPLHLQPMFLQ